MIALRVENERDEGGGAAEREGERCLMEGGTQESEILVATAMWRRYGQGQWGKPNERDQKTRPRVGRPQPSRTDQQIPVSVLPR